MVKQRRNTPFVLVLVGPRCSGKSSVGKRAAHLLGLAWHDTDLLIEKKEGWSCAALIDRDGWESFRLREKIALEEAFALAAASGGVISTGGGAVLFSSNRALMRRLGLVVYLKAPLAVLAGRMAAAQERVARPSLTGGDPVEELAHVLEERESLYRDAADYIVDASPDVPTVTATVLELASLAALPGGGKER